VKALSILTDHIKFYKESFGDDLSVKGTFYYDETNIFHKLRLTYKGTNNNLFEQSFFGLGGLYIEHGNNIDPSVMISMLKPQKSIKEFKYKYFSNNNTDVLNALDSKRFLNLMEWIDKNGILIHFTLLEYLYYGISDIIDSMPDALKTLEYNRLVKSVLYDAVRANSTAFLTLFYKFNYPDIARDRVKEFIGEFYDLYTSIVEYDNFNIKDFPKELLRQMIKGSTTAEEMVFLHDNTPLELFKEYADLYIDRPVRFANSTHVFDEVDEITNILYEWDIDYEKKLNAKFINSKDCLYVQFSDAIIGLISRVSNVILNKNKSDLHDFVSGLNNIQINVLRYLYKGINIGVRKSVFFNQFIGPDSFLDKQQYFINLIAMKSKNTR
jgi:hypothetical protein